ncbi:hypothetical protein [Cellulomonas sp. ATA003]|uniref:hypothetical protein n=1 Tax=Cellulomonas sp. ATA003 TaxID=3073064 RepID=UPI0028738AFB|nr:hypothetical protein [Cellulomonas sp. ATA003]WNB86963.1 hypothetical protein REH70_07375 [Cellulomonas sp. ATA003]
MSISLVTLLIPLLTDDVGSTRSASPGGWHDVGFLLGHSVVFCGSARAGSVGGEPLRSARSPQV